jgi:hypothetical protein
VKWVWPLSWWWRIRALEAERDALRALVKKHRQELTDAYIREGMQALGHAQAVASIVSMVSGSVSVPSRPPDLDR